MSEPWHLSFSRYYFQQGKQYAFHTDHPETAGLAGFRVVNINTDKIEVQLDSGDKELLYTHWGLSGDFTTYAFINYHGQFLWHQIGGAEPWYQGQVIDRLYQVSPLPTTLFPLIANYVIKAR